MIHVCYMAWFCNASHIFFKLVLNQDFSLCDLKLYATTASQLSSCVSDLMASATQFISVSKSHMKFVLVDIRLIM